MADKSMNDLDQELFSELTEPLVQPLLIHMVTPFVEGNDPKFALQINGNLLWEWRTLEGSLKKLFAVLQANLGAIGYGLEESAFDRVAIQLCTRTTNFLKQMKAERNGKRRSRKKAETWIGLSLYPKEISKTQWISLKNSLPYCTCVE